MSASSRFRNRLNPRHELGEGRVLYESRSVAAAGESLRKIRSASDQSAGLVVGISTVAKQQVDQAQRVAKTMESVSAIATDTQQGADSTVATINELVRMSNDLRKSIGQFRVSGR